MRDALLQFPMPAVDSGVTYTTSNQASDSIDLNAADPNIGAGRKATLKGVVTAGVTQTGTVTFTLQQSSDNGSSDAFANIPGVASAEFTDGAGLTLGDVIMEVALPPNCERYLRILATIGSGDITAGGFDFWIEFP